MLFQQVFIISKVFLRLLPHFFVGIDQAIG